MVSVTSTLPRVAFEYGHTSWAASVTLRASSGDAAGRLTSSSTAMPNPPVSV
jgi:hypothetical protein